MRGTRRSTARDGLRNRIEEYVLSHFGGLWALIQKSPYLNKRVNRCLINNLISKMKTRPYPFSLMSSYTCWDSLTDRTFSGRHLPAVERDPATLPDIDAVAGLFERPAGKPRLSSKSTVLFMYFAQWFTDGFLRTDRQNYLKNTSNHDIDLSPLYGLNPRYTQLLRAHQGGRLKSQLIGGEEFPCYFYNDDGTVKEEFRDLPLVYPEDEVHPERRLKLFAMGADRANISIGFVMMNTLFLREHNRICGLLAQEYPDWDDERLFQTSRNIAIVLVIKIVVEEYINHIQPYHFRFFLDPDAFPNERWYRQNWISVEFNLLYRWHSLVTDSLLLGGEAYPTQETLFHNDLVTERGLGPLFEDASLQAAGEIGLFNTTPAVMEAEVASIRLGRLAQLASYNDYRESCSFPRVTEFDQISQRPEVREGLKRLYGHVDDIEYYPGIFAEDPPENSVVAALIGRFVGIDAFSQALTNPLLAPGIFNEKTFTPKGMEIINRTKRLSDIVHRNIPDSGRTFVVTMTRKSSKSGG